MHSTQAGAGTSPAAAATHRGNVLSSLALIGSNSGANADDSSNRNNNAQGDQNASGHGITITNTNTVGATSFDQSIRG